MPGINTGPAQPDINRTNITATSHDLTDTVSADIGYIYSTLSQDPDDAQSNAVFFQIGRTFQTLPDPGSGAPTGCRKSAGAAKSPPSAVSALVFRHPCF